EQVRPRMHVYAHYFQQHQRCPSSCRRWSASNILWSTRRKPSERRTRWPTLSWFGWLSSSSRRSLTRASLSVSPSPPFLPLVVFILPYHVQYSRNPHSSDSPGSFS